MFLKRFAATLLLGHHMLYIVFVILSFVSFEKKNVLKYVCKTPTQMQQRVEP